MLHKMYDVCRAVPVAASGAFGSILANLNCDSDTSAHKRTTINLAIEVAGPIGIPAGGEVGAGQHNLSWPSKPRPGGVLYRQCDVFVLSTLSTPARHRQPNCGMSQTAPTGSSSRRARPGRSQRRSAGTFLNRGLLLTHRVAALEKSCQFKKYPGPTAAMVGGIIAPEMSRAYRLATMRGRCARRTCRSLSG
jgi:hypothetical protein